MDKNSTIKDRILTFIKHCGIKKVDFFSECGIQPSNFKGKNLKSSPGGDMLVNILTLYPHLSAEWLMRGIEPILIDENSSSIETNQTNQLAEPDLNLINKMLEQAEEIGRLKQCIVELEKKLLENKPEVVPAQSLIKLPKRDASKVVPQPFSLIETDITHAAEP